jgi:hypothetical protein
MNRPIDTPWGPSQSIKEVAPGIHFVSTASHGGLQLSEERQHQMPEGLQEEWFEEDCQWAWPTAVFAKEMKPKDVWHAMKTLAGQTPKIPLPQAQEIANTWERENGEKFLAGSFGFNGATMRETQTYRRVKDNAQMIVAKTRRGWTDRFEFPATATREEILGLPETELLQDIPNPTSQHKCQTQNQPSA